MTTTNTDDGFSRHDLARYYYLLRAKVWLIVLTIAVSLLAAGAYVITAQKVYAARAVIQVEQEPQKVVNIQDINSEDFKSLEVLKTIEQALTSQSLILRLIKVNNLDRDPSFAEPKSDGTRYTDAELIRKFEQKLSVQLRHGTRLIDIVVEDPDPHRSQQLAESLVKEFASEGFEYQSNVSKTASRFLVDEAERLKAKLQKSEQALQQYREQHQTVSLDENQNIVVEKLKELNNKVTQASAERLKLEADVAAVENAKGARPEDLLAIPSVAALPEVADIRKQLSDRETEFAALSERYGPQHPKYQQMKGELNELSQALNRAVRKAGAILSNSYKAAKATEQKLLAALKQQEQAALELNRVAMPYAVLERDVESDRALYESIVEQIKETNVTGGLEKRNVRLIESPVLPSKPVKPRKLRTLALGLLGGLGMGIGIIVAIDWADTSLRSVDQAEDEFGIPVLAAIPEVRREDVGWEPALSGDPASHEAEAFRTLRTSLSLLGREESRRTIIFTSANPEEGKSYCSLNCAAAFAHQGLRTLLVDADLRRPRLSDIFKESRNSPGLTAFLTGRAPLMQACRPTSIENLTVLPAGRPAPNPAELLASGKVTGAAFGELLNDALLHFERIVVDSAPVNAVSDTLIIARSVQTLCVVIRSGRTPRRAIARACRLVHQAGHTPDGLVLNCMARSGDAGYYSYYYPGKYDSAVYGSSDTGRSA
jgi:succinoglycan biosynthesis transport protein ExoP